MLMQAEPVYQCYKALEDRIGKRPRVVYLSPQGQTFNQKMAEEFAEEEELVFLCGHYEGIDERVLEEIVTDYVSIGDYVLTGGELPAMIMVDAISSLVPGVLHNDVSAEFERFPSGSAGKSRTYRQGENPCSADTERNDKKRIKFLLFG